MQPHCLTIALEYNLVSFGQFKQEICGEIRRFLACYGYVCRHAFNMVGAIHASYCIIQSFAPVSRSDDNTLMQSVSQGLQ